MKDAQILRARLIALLGRIVSVEEMRDALEMKQSTYYDQVKEGRLMSLDNLKLLARNLNVNEVELLAECGLLARTELKEYCERNICGSCKYSPNPLTIRRKA
jgi:hypothetical protein